MTARFAWVLNLDAELELAQPNYTPRARVTQQLELYGKDSRRLLGPDDVLLWPRAPDSAPFERSAPRLGRSWCPTPRALALFASFGIEPEPHPEAGVLRRVNHRRFAHELGGGLPGQRYLEDRDELDEALRNATAPLLLKRPLAFAGRGQTRVYAYAKITDKERSWIAASAGRNTPPTTVTAASSTRSTVGAAFRSVAKSRPRACARAAGRGGVEPPARGRLLHVRPARPAHVAQPVRDRAGRRPVAGRPESLRAAIIRPACGCSSGG